MYNVFLVPRMEEWRSLHPLLKQDFAPLCPCHDYYLKAFTRDKHYLLFWLLLSCWRANRRLTVNTLLLLLLLLLSHFSLV